MKSSVQWTMLCVHTMSMTGNVTVTKLIDTPDKICSHSQQNGDTINTQRTQEISHAIF